MNNLFQVVKFTYLTNLKSKAFIVSTFITIILIGLLFSSNNLVEKQMSKKTSVIGIVQTEKEVIDLIEKTNGKEKFKFIVFKEEEKAKESLWNKTISSYIEVKEENGELKGVYKAYELANQSQVYDIQNLLSDVKLLYGSKKIGIQTSEMEQLFSPIELKQIALKENAKDETTLKQSIMVVFMLMFIIYMSVVFYGSTITVEVASEKSSRIMEVLVSSIKPEIQMFGKIIGIALIGISQYTIFALFSIVFFKTNYQQTTIQLEKVPIETFFYAFIFFILGYLFYGLLLAMLASIVDRIEDVHLIVTPINLLLIIGFVIGVLGFVTPDSLFIQIASYIPFFTPMLFFLRITLLDISIVEIILVISWMMTSIYLTGKLASKIYKGGVLTYGKGSIKKAFKSMRETN